MPVNGAIFNTASSRPLFEDRRARLVGDTLTINIVEKTQASKKSDTRRTQPERRRLRADGRRSAVQGVRGPTWARQRQQVRRQGEKHRANDFTSTITVTVIDVAERQPARFGRKTARPKEGEEFIRFGVVNPNTITGANTVVHAGGRCRMEFKANGFLDTARSAAGCRVFPHRHAFLIEPEHERHPKILIA